MAENRAITEDEKLDLRSVILCGAAVIIVFFGCFGAWAGLTPLHSAAIAPGVVAVDGQRKTIKHLEGGIVAEILVRDGDRVAAGQTLLRLDDTRSRAELEQLRVHYRTLAATESRLTAERDRTAEIVFPAWLVEQARIDPSVAVLLDAQEAARRAQDEILDTQTAILEQRIAQLREEVNGLSSEIEAEESQLALFAEEIKDMSELVDEGFVAKPRLLEFQRAYAEIGGSRSKRLSDIAQARQTITETEFRISELSANRYNSIVEELRETRTQRLDLEERIRAAEDVLERIEIKANVGGTVVGLQVHTPGGVIAPGEALMDIVPADTELVVEARLSPSDIDVTSVGMDAMLRLTAFNQRTVAPVQGKVVSVSADKLVDQVTGAPYFLARLVVTENIGLQGLEIVPGMDVEVMIITSRQSALANFMEPIGNSLNRAFREH